MKIEKSIPDGRLAALIAALGSQIQNERQKAASDLEAFGDVAEPALRKAAGDGLPLEHVRRIDQVLSKLAPQSLTADHLRNLRAVSGREVGSAGRKSFFRRTIRELPVRRICAPWTRQGRSAHARNTTRGDPGTPGG